MSDDMPEKSSSWQGRFARLMPYLFPEREFILRTEGRLTYLKLSQKSQIAFVFLLLAFVGWTAFGSFSFVLHDKIIAAKDGGREILCQSAGNGRHHTRTARKCADNDQGDPWFHHTAPTCGARYGTPLNGSLEERGF